METQNRRMTELGELYQRLKDYSKTDYYPYHMPGHKRLLCGEFPREIMDIDITEIDGFDNLHAPEEILDDYRTRQPDCTAQTRAFTLSTEVPAGFWRQSVRRFRGAGGSL